MKFDSIFKNAIDKFVDNYDPDKPQEFLNSNSSPEETILQKIVSSMGEEGRNALSLYITKYNTGNLIRLLSTVQSKLLSQRESLVKIHKDVFKGYRNFSIMQELSVIFEKYNGIIIEEFFPDRSTMDKVKYNKIRKRILALYDELQIRYQGVDAPADQTRSPNQATAAQLTEEIKEKGTENVKEAPGKPPERGIKGREPSKIRDVIDEAEQNISDKEAKKIQKEAENNAKARNTQGTEDHLFASLLDDKNDNIVADLEAQERKK